MTQVQKDIVRAMARNNLNMTHTANELYRTFNCIAYHRGRLLDLYGLDMRNFYDLQKLLELANKDQ